MLQEQFIGNQGVAAFNEGPEITLDAGGIHKRVFARTVDFYGCCRVSDVRATGGAVINLKAFVFSISLDFDVKKHGLNSPSICDAYGLLCGLFFLSEMMLQLRAAKVSTGNKSFFDKQLPNLGTSA